MASEHASSEFTNVYGNEDDYYYYPQQLAKMTEAWDKPPLTKRKEGLGKDIRTYRIRQNPIHPREQRPIPAPRKLPPLPTDREMLRVPLREDRHVVVQTFRDVYVNIREFYRHDVTQKWLPGKKGINLSVDDWNALKEVSAKIDSAVQALKDNE